MSDKMRRSSTQSAGGVRSATRHPQLSLPLDTELRSRASVGYIWRRVDLSHVSLPRHHLTLPILSSFSSPLPLPPPSLSFALRNTNPNAVYPLPVSCSGARAIVITSSLRRDHSLATLLAVNDVIMSGNSGPPGSISFYRSNINIFLGDVRHAGNGSNARLNLGQATNAGVAAGDAVTTGTDPDQSTTWFRTKHWVPEHLFEPFEGSARDIPGFHRIKHGQFVRDGVTGNTLVVWAVARRDAPYVLSRAMGLTGYQAVQISPALYDVILEEAHRIRAQRANEARDASEDARYHLGIDEDEDCTYDEANLAE